MRWLATGLGLSLALLIGRVSGFARELLIAAQFGAERTADQLILLLTLPDVLTGLLTTGAMLVVLVPEFRRSSAARARQLFRESSLLVAGALGMFALCAGLVFPFSFLGVFAPGFSNAELENVVPYVPLFLLLAPLTGLASITTAWLRSEERFALPAYGTLIVNIAIISGMFIGILTGRPILGTGIGVIAGGILRYVVQLGALREKIPGPGTTTRVVDGTIASRYLTALFAGGFFLLFPVVARAFASGTEGGIAIFNYAVKLTELPLGIAISIVSILLLPRMTDAVDSDKSSSTDGKAASSLSRSTMYSIQTMAWAIALPAAWYAGTLVVLIFGLVGLEAGAVAQVSALAAISFLALPAQGAITHAISVLSAANCQRIILQVSILSLAIFLALAWWLFGRMGMQGLMIALVVSYFSAWLLFALMGSSATGWQMTAFGISRDQLVVVGTNVLVAACFASLSLALPSSILLDAILGMLWCAVAVIAVWTYYAPPEVTA